MGFQSRTAAAAVGAAPAGSIHFFGNSVIPNGYLPCDGGAVSRTVYAALFNAIGTTFGVGDGSTTFNVPDMRGRAPMGEGTGAGLTARTVGQALGTETHQITVAEMPSHDHGGATGSHTHEENPNVWMNSPNTVGGNHFLTRDASGVFMTVESVGGGARAVQSTDGATASIPSQGSSNAHPNIQPSLVCKHGIKYVAESTTTSGSSPTIQKFLSGSGTYNLPPSCKWIRVRLWGAGGGGGGGNGGAGGAGTPGGNTTFGSSFLTANGGAGGYNAPNSNYGGSGGTYTINAPAIGFGVNGNSGANASANFEAFPPGGVGGAGPFGGAGSGATNGPGEAADANSGAGGGGGSSSGSSTYAGNGGGSGAYIDVIVPNPLSSYAYSVGNEGTGGTAGAGGTNGGAGSKGMIIVEEYY